MRFTTTGGILLGLAAVLVAGCVSSEAYHATVSYVLEPTQQLPPGLHSLAILDEGVQVTADDTARAKKWSKISADMMEQMVLDSKQKFGTEITLAKRRETGKVMAEQDLKMSGQTAGGAAAQNAKLADVQALISCQMNILVEVNKSSKTTFDITSLYGGGWWHGGYGGGTGAAREAEAISRNIALQCKFAMLDAANSKALFEYAPKPYRKTDSKKPSAVFGRSSGEADLDPVDMYIGELVERGTREFVSMFVPVEVEYTYDLESAATKESAAGIRAMRADNYEAAISNFKAAVQNDPNDARSMFAMGVAAEMTQDWDTALKCYRQAAAMPDLDEDVQAAILAAKERVTTHKDRIRKHAKKA